MYVKVHGLQFVKSGPEIDSALTVMDGVTVSIAVIVPIIKSFVSSSHATFTVSPTANDAIIFTTQTDGPKTDG